MGEEGPHAGGGGEANEAHSGIRVAAQQRGGRSARRQLLNSAQAKAGRMPQRGRFSGSLHYALVVLPQLTTLLILVLRRPQPAAAALPATAGKEPCGTACPPFLVIRRRPERQRTFGGCTSSSSFSAGIAAAHRAPAGTQTRTGLSKTPATGRPRQGPIMWQTQEPDDGRAGAGEAQRLV